MSELKKRQSLKKIFSRKVNHALIGIGIIGASVVGLKQYNTEQAKLQEKARIEAYMKAKQDFVKANNKAFRDWEKWDSLSIFEKTTTMHYKNISYLAQQDKKFSMVDVMSTHASDSLVYKGSDEDKLKLAKFFETVSMSETGRDEVENMDSMGVKVSLPAGLRFYGAYLDQTRELLMRDENRVPKNMSMIWLASHEMRHCVQDAKKVIGVGYDSLSMDERFFVGKLVEADACAYGTQVVWELKEKGIDLGWDELKSNPIYGRCFEAYENAIKKNSKANKNGEGLRESFEAWYTCKGLETNYEKTMCGNIFRASYRASDPRTYFGYDKDNVEKISRHISKIGLMKNGINYLTDVKVDGSENIMDRNSKYWQIHIKDTKEYQKAVEAVNIAVANKEGRVFELFANKYNKDYKLEKTFTPILLSQNTRNTRK